MDKIINKKSGVTLIIKNEIICTVNCEIHEGLKSIPAANAPSTDIPQTDIFVNGKKTYGNAYTFNDDIDAEKFVSKLPKPGQEFYRLHDNRYIETLVCEYYATDNPMNDVT
ncbi:MAG: hypothetical protein LBI38_03980, partial [Oscillospiraceae bacterium]|nr:hypothetical protein [Oscillospiraceae bacterium]